MNFYNSDEDLAQWKEFHIEGSEVKLAKMTDSFREEKPKGVCVFSCRNEKRSR